MDKEGATKRLSTLSDALLKQTKEELAISLQQYIERMSVVDAELAGHRLAKSKEDEWKSKAERGSAENKALRDVLRMMILKQEKEKEPEKYCENCVDY